MRKQTTIAKWVTGTALAAALVLAVPHKAEAQVAFGVQVGVPAQAYGYAASSGYAAPAYGYGYNDWQHRQYIERERREQWEAARAAEWRHEQWERQRFYDHSGWYGHGWYGR